MDDIDVSFIKNAVLKKNIENVHDDIAKLKALMSFADNGIQGCLRKTIVVYIASVIEALLLWKIKREVGTGKVALSDEWRHRVLSSVLVTESDEEYHISFTKQTKERKDVNKLDFNRMIALCRSEKLLQEKVLSDLDAVRKMRNRVHIGGLTTVTKTFPQKNIEFALEMLERTVLSVQ